MGAFTHILRHVATPLAQVEGTPADDEDWAEGEPGEVEGEPAEGTPFNCILFLPTGTEQASPFRPRQVTRPTLLYEPEDVDGGDVAIAANHELELEAADEPAPVRAMLEGRWQVDGDPLPFGPPGTTIGLQAYLQRVKG